MQKRLPLTKEIALVLITKVILLYTLWLVCFSNPLEKRSMPTYTADHLFNIHLDNTL